MEFCSIQPLMGQHDGVMSNVVECSKRTGVPKGLWLETLRETAKDLSEYMNLTETKSENN